MRKIICCALALLLMMGAAVVPAAAAEAKSGFYDIGTVTGVTINPKNSSGYVKGSSETIDGKTYTLYNGSDRLEVVYNGAEAGHEYAIYLIEGTTLNLDDTDSFYYVNQINVDEKATSSTITYSVFPDERIDKTSKNIELGLFIKGNDGKTDIFIPLKYLAGASGDFMKGDIKIDGIIDVKDVTLLRRYLSDNKKYPLDATQLLAAEILEDGNIDVKDVTLLRRYLSDSKKYPLP